MFCASLSKSMRDHNHVLSAASASCIADRKEGITDIASPLITSQCIKNLTPSFIKKPICPIPFSDFLLFLRQRRLIYSIFGKT